MRKAIGVFLPAVLGIGCATSLTSAGARVKVYGWDGPATAATPLAGCRLIQTTAPFTEQESERAAADPYRKQRNDVAEKGGNVLLVFSQPMVRRPSTDCAPNDKSPGCLESSQTWYRTSFGYYACADDAAARLDAEASAAGSPGPLFSLKFGHKSKPAPAPAQARPPRHRRPRLRPPLLRRPRAPPTWSRRSSR